MWGLPSSTPAARRPSTPEVRSMQYLKQCSYGLLLSFSSSMYGRVQCLCCGPAVAWPHSLDSAAASGLLARWVQ